MIYQQLSKGEFRDAFIRMGRKDNFSYEGLGALYDYLGENEEDLELDVIGLCCDYMEDSIANVLSEYRLSSIEELEESTCIIWKDDERVLYLGF